MFSGRVCTGAAQPHVHALIVGSECMRTGAVCNPAHGGVQNAVHEKDHISDACSGEKLSSARGLRSRPCCRQFLKRDKSPAVFENTMKLQVAGPALEFLDMLSLLNSLACHAMGLEHPSHYQQKLYSRLAALRCKRFCLFQADRETSTQQSLETTGSPLCKGRPGRGILSIYMT